MLDAATPEAVRRAVESRVLRLLPVLRALGVFELFELRHPAMRAWLEDEMADMPGRQPSAAPLFLLKQT
jgi:hypothetical protein